MLEGRGRQPAWAEAERSLEWPVLTPVSSLVAGREQPEPAPQPQGQSKWGFAPGEEDTLDLNLENRGASMLLLHAQGRTLQS